MGLSLSRAASLVVLGSIALAPAAVVVACGGNKPAQTPPMPSESASAAPEASPSAAVPAVSSAAPATSDTGAAPPPAVPTSAIATIKTDASWASCHQSFKATNKDVSKDVVAMAKACAATTKMKEVGKTLTGKQADEDKPQSFPLEAKGGHCYRVYAQAADGIKDFDVVVKDSAGVVAAQDSTDDPSPVVTEDGAVCFKKDDKASVVVSVGMGKGAYAVQIWSD